jgi:hypothetical protein
VAADQVPDRHVRGPHDQVVHLEPLRRHRLAAREERRVDQDEAAEPAGLLDPYPHADRAAPVVADQHRVPETELVEHAADDVRVPVVAVPVLVERLVRASEAGVVHGHAAVARVAQRRDDLAEQVRPGRLPVQQHDRPPLALVVVGDPEPADLAVARLQVEAGQAFEPLFRRPDGLDDLRRGYRIRYPSSGCGW